MTDLINGTASIILHLQSHFPLLAFLAFSLLSSEIQSACIAYLAVSKVRALEAILDWAFLALS